jgi:23S rRNA (pseudouridine1915-N3)-methyltransferase
MKTTIISVGRVKAAWLKEGVDYYRRLLSRYVGVELIAVKDPDSAHLPAETVRNEEALRLLDRSDPRAYRVALDRQGHEFNTEELAVEIAEIERRYSQVQILIGGAYGFAGSLRKQVDSTWSLSRLTYPHEMAALIVLEQLFRVYSLRHGSRYHK